MNSMSILPVSQLVPDMQAGGPLIQWRMLLEGSNFCQSLFPYLQSTVFHTVPPILKSSCRGEKEWGADFCSSRGWSDPAQQLVAEMLKVCYRNFD